MAKEKRAQRRATPRESASREVKPTVPVSADANSEELVRLRRRPAANASRKPSEARRERPSASAKRRANPRRTSTAKAEEPTPPDPFSGEDEAERPQSRLEDDPELHRRADWHTSDSNIYLADDEPVADDWYEDEDVLGVVPVRDVGPTRKRRTTGAKRARALVVILAIFAGMAALTFFVWITRTVEFSVNDAIVTTHYGTSLADYLAGTDLSFTPGNLVSVAGEVLQEGGGDAYSATVNGQLVRPVEAKDLHITGGEIVQVANGADVMEDYDVEVVEALPLLEFDGQAGAISYVAQWGKPGTQELWTGKISGAQAAGGYVEEPQNAVIKTINVEPDDGRQLVALTFDDGPSAYTTEYLRILDSYGAKGTFFMRGANIIEHPDIARAVLEAGHQVATKTDSYESLSDMDAERLQATLQDAFQNLATELDVHTTTFRPPFGAFTHDDWLKSGGAASMSVIWNCDSLDWQQAGTSSIVNYSMEGLGNGSVILLHDGGGNYDQTLEALPILIERLQAQGYELVTVEELLRSDSSVDRAMATGDQTMPEGSVWPTQILTTE